MSRARQQCLCGMCGQPLSPDHACGNYVAFPAPRDEEKEEWENTYPLSTFSGETKKELVEFINNLLSRQRAEIVEEINEAKIYKFLFNGKWQKFYLITEAIRKIKEEK